jgi:hypothetical protein
MYIHCKTIEKYRQKKFKTDNGNIIYFENRKNNIAILKKFYFGNIEK